MLLALRRGNRTGRLGLLLLASFMALSVAGAPALVEAGCGEGCPEEESGSCLPLCAVCGTCSPPALDPALPTLALGPRAACGTSEPVFDLLSGPPSDVLHVPKSLRA